MPPPSLLSRTTVASTVTTADREQAVHVVVVRQVAGDEHERVGCRAAGTERRRSDAVDTAGPAVAENGQVVVTGAAKAVHISYRHTVRNEQCSRVRGQRSHI